MDSYLAAGYTNVDRLVVKLDDIGHTPMVVIRMNQHQTLYLTQEDAKTLVNSISTLVK